MIKILFVDVDGTLTDSGYFVSEDPYVPMVKKFSTRDFMGLQMLAREGVVIAFITGAGDECIDRKVEQLLWDDMVRVHTGVSNKLKLVQKLYGDEIDFADMAFIGDDLNDMALLQSVGVAACPADADEEILKYIESRKDGFIMKKKAGEGAVREFTNMLLKSFQEYDNIDEGDNDG